MTARLEFSLLGPLLVRRDGAVVPIAAGRQRALLTALLLNSGQVVQADQLIDMLWEAGPPTSARASLHNYVKRLRQALGDAGHSRIITQGRGYTISVAADELDVSRFEALLRAARAAMRAGAWSRAASEAHAALSLWRGEPLADLEAETLAWQEIPRLAEMRLQALEIRLEADLRLGGQADVIPELRRLVRAHPLREQLHALLILALYRCSRQAEALAAYQNARQVLIEELGTEPGAGLRETHQRILTADPVLESASLSEGGYQSAVPRVLPAAVRHFAGRQDELTALHGLLDQADEEAPGTVVISAIGGTAGVGKTALAVHWAHQVVERFPDGQLYVNLRGYDPGPPVPAGDALAGFLRAMGVPGHQIPAEADERAARYRSLLAGRRMLVLLDNARSAEQVRPLLPAAAGCLALVTSRDALVGLVARDGARRLELDLLPLAEAAGLLRALIGERAATDPGATQTLAVQCARLPLALRVAAERAIAHPGASVASLVAELADERSQLDLLEAGGDPRTAIRAVFSWSYRDLDAAAARAFRLTALNPGSDLDAYATAALTGTTLEQACLSLSRLARAHLIQPSRTSWNGWNARYSRHDLLRTYARELAVAEDSEEERLTALTRLFDHYLHAAGTAANTLYPADQSRRPPVPEPASPVPPVAAPAAAQAWLDDERPSLVAVAAHAASRDWPGHAIPLALTLFRYLDTAGHFPEAITVHDCARRAAKQVGDPAAEAEALTSLGSVDLRQGRYQQAADHFRRAQALFREAGNRSGQARSLGNLGIVLLQQGGYREAARHLELAATLLREIGDHTGEARVLGNLGILSRRQGHYRQAADYHRQALTMFRAIGDRAGEASALTDLGDVHLLRGRYRSATDYHQRSLALFRETGYPAGQAKALNGLGESFLSAGRAADARTRHIEALDLAVLLDDQYEQARAHDGLGHACRALGDLGQARRQWREALALYTRIGTPEADQIRRQLAG